MKTNPHPDTGDELVLAPVKPGCLHCVFWPERTITGSTGQCRFHVAFMHDASHPFMCADGNWMKKVDYVAMRLTE